MHMSRITAARSAAFGGMLSRSRRRSNTGSAHLLQQAFVHGDELLVPAGQPSEKPVFLFKDQNLFVLPAKLLLYSLEAFDYGGGITALRNRQAMEIIFAVAVHILIPLPYSTFPGKESVTPRRSIRLNALRAG
jgi:hypothetical protein